MDTLTLTAAMRRLMICAAHHDIPTQFRGGRMKNAIVRTCAIAATLLMVIAAQRDGHAQKNAAPARAFAATHAVKLPSHGGISVQHLLKKRRGADLGDARMSPMGRLAYLAGTG